MLAVRRAHQQRVRELCVVHFSPPSTGIAFWIDARRNEKWRACFYVNWLSARPRPVIRELTIRRNKPRTQRNSIKASHLSLISHCMGEIRNSQMCGDTNVFWFVHQLLPTIRKELLFLSKHHPGLGRPTRGGGGAFAALPLKKLTKHHLHRPHTSYISFRRPCSLLNSEEIRASIMYFSSDYL